MDALNPGAIVKLNTASIWNQCSGVIEHLEEEAELVVVMMPGSQKMAFLPSELLARGLPGNTLLSWSLANSLKIISIRQTRFDSDIH
tara:strand:+ start:468 stop:728 length:261 start_codon:yes stop_codon:yes gene_type:complete